MAVIGFVGPKRSGKTLFGVKQGLKWIRQGRRVYSNFGLVGSYDIQSPNDLAGLPQGSACIIDEVAGWFPASESTKVSLEVHLLLAQEGKHGLDIIWTAQYLKQVATPWRRLTDRIWTVKRFGIRVSPAIIESGYGLLYWVHRLGIIRATGFRVVDFNDDCEPKEKAKSRGVKTLWLMTSSRYFGAYDTHQIIMGSDKMAAARIRLEQKTFLVAPVGSSSVADDPIELKKGVLS